MKRKTIFSTFTASLELIMNQELFGDMYTHVAYQIERLDGQPKKAVLLCCLVPIVIKTRKEIEHTSGQSFF